MRDAPFAWKEEIPPGSRQQSSQNFANDSGLAVLNFSIDWNTSTIRKAIKYILGVNRVTPAFDPTGPTNQGPYSLSRIPPARHPRWLGMRATKILSITGIGLDGLGQPKQLFAFGGEQGNWAKAYFSVQFEAPTYPILSDADMKVTLGDGTELYRNEHMRYVTKIYDPNIETLARRGETWIFVDERSRAITLQVPGDRLVRQAKGTLKWTWHNVPEDYLMLGKTIPSNFRRRIATVNALPFPQDYFVDQNTRLRDTITFGLPTTEDNSVQFQPGELLLLAPRITPRVQLLTDSMLDLVSIDPYNGQRSYDVEIQWIDFSPDTDEGLTIDLRPLGGSQLTPVRGHQLSPLPVPSPTGYRFYATVLGATTPVAGLNTRRPQIGNDHGLLYRYTDHEILFHAAQSMNAQVGL